jgi:hypothetical protein
MAFNDVNPTLRYLTDAGNLLANMSPETSAFVMRQRDSLVFETELTQPESQRQNVCTCCGHILVLGCGGSALVFKSEKTVPNKARSTGHGGQKEPANTKPRAGPTKVLTCGHCGRLTETKFPAPAPISRRAMRARRVVQAQAQAQAQVPAPATNSRSTREAARELVQKSTASGNSKKRAKSRKAGLQALLEQSSASRGGLGLGLSLSSFMQK